MVAVLSNSIWRGWKMQGKGKGRWSPREEALK